MNDILGQSLALGDVVAIPDGSGFPNSLRLGRILRAGTKMVIVEPIKGHPMSTKREVRRYFADVVKVQL